ncbi:Uma2 family endonuclease [Altericista sp. CCNU0014]|uniref:Uma2 family endonuclease n=1 Tax=Altericista sp. CCNU0014 TaxID=3082949 RepID=UPI00384B8C36
MTVAIATPLSQIELTPGSAMQISGVNWESYIALMQELGNNRSTRIAYANGVLEIRMPGQQHESINRVLAAIALTLAEELGFEFNDLGSMTLNRHELSKGLEPDSCFYIQNAQAGQGLDPTIASDLPPDLALEIDIAHRSDTKLSIYQAIGVPEVWLYQRDRLKIKHLNQGQYVDVLTSLAFPTVSATQIDQWLELRRTGTDLTVVRAVRQFCRTGEN